MLQHTDTDQINHAVSIVTRAKRSRHCSGYVVFAGLLACDIQRLQSVLNTAVRLVAGDTGSSRRGHAFSHAARPSLAAYQAARRVQTVHDGPPVLVRRRSILPTGPDHVVC